MSRYLLLPGMPYAYDILRPLQEAIRQRGEEAVWFAPGSKRRFLRDDELSFSSVQEAFSYAPHAIFAPGNMIPYFLPGLKVQIFHGFGIDKKGHFRIRGFYDLYCTHGPLTTSRFKELANRHGNFQVVETGWPKMDPLFASERESVARQVGKPVVLFAPTFSPAFTSATALADEIIRLSATGRWQWVVKFHDKMDPETVKAYRSAASSDLVIADSETIVPLMRQADVMVSDTSSVVAEFLLLDKPVVTFRTRTPGPHLLDVQDPGELQGALERALQRPADLMKEALAYTAAMHPYRDGRSSERILDAVNDFLANPPLLKKKPLNLYRKFKARKTFGYWGPAAPESWRR